MDQKNENNNPQPEVKKKRVRRTKKAIETLLMDSAVKLIEKYGFKDLTVSKLVQTAGVEAPVFYNRYQDLNEFLDKFVRKYDYWLNDSIKIDTNSNPKQIAVNLLLSLTDALDRNKIIQQLLVWELTENNYITNRTAESRGRSSKQLFNYLSDSYQNAEVNFHAAMAIIASGAYYIILHKRYNDCKITNIDYNSKEGMRLIRDTIELMIKKIFDDIEPKSFNDNSLKEKELSMKIECAKTLIRNKVSPEIIKEATGLSDETLVALGSNP